MAVFTQDHSIPLTMSRLAMKVSSTTYDGLHALTRGYRRTRAKRELMALPMSVREDVGLTQERICKILSEIE